MAWQTTAERLRDQLYGSNFGNGNWVWIHYHPKRELGVEVEVAYDVPDSTAVVSYSIWYDSVEDFCSDLAIFDVEDTFRIVPEDLIKRFEVGVARLFCMVGNDEYLFFQRDDVLLYATDCNGEKHLVCKFLVDVEDYVRYTREYYEDWDDKHKL